MRWQPFFCSAMIVVLVGSAGFAAEATGDWPRWRGPQGTGVAAQANPPTSWSESKNVRWKIEVPGAGSSTPIILGDRVYVATAVKTDRQAPNDPQADAGETAGADSRPPRGEGGRREAGRPGGRPGNRGGFGRFGGRGRFGGGPPPTHFYAFMVIAYDRKNGDEIWRSTLTEAVPHEAGHNTNTFASSSPLTDGERLYVSFGSRGVFALDFDGNPLWEKQLGQMQTRAQFGEGSSPAVAEGILVVPFDHEGESFVVGLDAKSGDQLWRQERDERTTWATPLITEFEGRHQVILNGSNRVRSYDLRTGEIIWECGGQAGNPIPTPVRYQDSVIVMTGYRGYAIYSIPLSAKGDITDSDVVTWSEDDAAPYVPSPVLYEGQLYFLKSNQNTLVSRDAATGESIFGPKRLPGINNLYASPVAASGHVYLTGRDGTTVVLKHGKTLDVVAENPLDAEIDASAAIVGDEIYFRSKSHLYCIAESPADSR